MSPRFIHFPHLCTVQYAAGLLFYGYGWSEVFVNIGLRNALLQSVLDCHVHGMGGSLLRFSIAGTSDQLERKDLLFVVVGNTFVAVQRLLVLGADFVDETIDVVSGRRNDIGNWQHHAWFIIQRL
jgi:hypothetical protein